MPNRAQRTGLRYIVYGLLLMLLALVLWRQRQAFIDSLELIGRVNVGWIISGLLVFMVSVPAGTLVYLSLSPKKLDFARTFQVQIASLFVNKLLPAGSGALGINYVYLRANKVTKALAAAIVAGNNLLGFTGHLLLLTLSCLLFSESLPQTGAFSVRSLVLVGVIICWAIAILLLAYQAHRWKTPKVIKQLMPLYKRPKKLLLALLFSCILTASFAAALGIASRAFGYELSPAVLMVVLSFGVAAASAVPTPGGIGAAEAGIFAGLHSYGLPTTDALSIAILYRVISFWLPLAIGIFGFGLMTKHRLLSQSGRK